MRKRRKWPIILAGCILMAGCILLAYPGAAKWFSSMAQTAVIEDYIDSFGNMDAAEAEQEIQRAVQYNKRLTHAVSALGDPFRTDDLEEMEQEDSLQYETLLNFTQEGVMGYIEIPKIDVMLPIYHGVDDTVLSKGVGHMPETSLPVGGESTHAVLAAHSGMSNAKLFTDLPKLEIGDVFYIHIYNRTLTYTVDQIKTVLPAETSDLAIVDGEDYVTLITCVPIAVNSHRLLVRGTRTA